jgi:hypothetical protein
VNVQVRSYVRECTRGDPRVEIEIRRAALADLQRKFPREIAGRRRDVVRVEVAGCVRVVRVVACAVAVEVAEVAEPAGRVAPRPEPLALSRAR